MSYTTGSPSWSLVVGVGDSIANLGWEEKDALDRMPRAIDISAWLANKGLTVASGPQISTDPSLQIEVLNQTPVGKTTMRVSGGKVGTLPVALQFSLVDSASVNYFLNLVIQQPVRSNPTASLTQVTTIPVNNPVTIGGQQILIGGNPVTIGE